MDPKGHRGNTARVNMRPFLVFSDQRLIDGTGKLCLCFCYGQHLWILTLCQAEHPSSLQKLWGVVTVTHPQMSSVSL